jgi:hypothetical protein
MSSRAWASFWAGCLVTARRSERDRLSNAANSSGEFPFGERPRWRPNEDAVEVLHGPDAEICPRSNRQHRKRKTVRPTGDLDDKVGDTQNSVVRVYTTGEYLAFPANSQRRAVDRREDGVVGRSRACPKPDFSERRRCEPFVWVKSAEQTYPGASLRRHPAVLGRLERELSKRQCIRLADDCRGGDIHPDGKWMLIGACCKMV